MIPQALRADATARAQMKPQRQDSIAEKHIQK
jgi:hypothetical protein